MPLTPPKSVNPRLGRLKAKDPTDKQFLLRRLLGRPPDPLPKAKTWNTAWVGDQGETSECVGFSWHGFLECEPIVSTSPAPDAIYAGAQANDEFKGPPPPYDGSSVRGGAKYLTSLKRLVDSYHWAFTLTDVLHWLATGGPLVFGTDWYEGMFDADKKGFVRKSGAIAGGHAYVCIGYDQTRKAVRCVNSWGTSWGQKGRFWLPYDLLTELLGHDGEACAAVEIAPAKKAAATVRQTAAVAMAKEVVKAKGEPWS